MPTPEKSKLYGTHASLVDTQKIIATAEKNLLQARQSTSFFKEHQTLSHTQGSVLNTMSQAQSM